MPPRSRRQFLRSLAFIAGAVGVVGCSGGTQAATPGPDVTPARSAVPEPTIGGETAMPSALPIESTAVTEPTLVAPTPEVLATATPGISPKRLVGYLPSWTLGPNYEVADVPVKNLTHVIYAFAKINDAGECISASPKIDPGAFAELRQTRATTTKLHSSISIGGDGGASRFPTAAKTVDARRRFATSAVAYMKQHGFDGIDLDWEYPDGIVQKGNLTALLAELRSQLDEAGRADGKRYFLTIAAPAGPAHYVNFELDRLSSYVDWINLMTYSFHGTWSATTNFNAPLFASSTDPSLTFQRIIYNTDAAVQAYLGAGVPADKIVVGVPFYGYGWKGVPDINHGLYQVSDGLPVGTRAPGVFTYRDLKNHYIDTFERYWHDEAQVPWLYDPNQRVMITYDDPASLGVKADYVRDRGLGGVMIWELSTDDVNHSLVTAIHDHLHANDAS